ncbi:hypothetical protein M2459_000532 [Parabacteroides sp. PF5-5]|nr:hypothetical protein [Parabacteroides sp. PH5-39]MDH6314856.1 hypothetical protein [Parabacteroides sp. PF5-13]MDH6318193.1 hypothetical protein [Parabacteroides sp. PH5-13]MDH6321874.1 hypothetical protein [Parabacteroides sp. PH5-8]MDH6325998.1 hypothetical protein [Parabacteroides sp. PH5-41]MDH6333798.1 hypothetical protein [Parabacteroides sp. PF5-5]MDH6344863.1 hypothetical protein [Parabacteroides sp. PH5-46]MDH6359867.1 hypothetical protein [Parabacteroides sp. PH5-16]MDH6375534.
MLDRAQAEVKQRFLLQKDPFFVDLRTKHR